MQDTEKYRKNPIQKRAINSVDCILEAATQLLEANGKERFNTNAIAERAGVSVGTLYRYFPDKQSIMDALARKEVSAHHQATAAALEEQNGALARDRAVIRAFIGAFAGRARARKIAMSSYLAEVDHSEVAASFEKVERGFAMADGRRLSRLQSFVLSRAIHGAMRAAVLEGSEYLQSPEFEDELVRLGRAYLGYVK